MLARARRSKGQGTMPGEFEELDVSGSVEHVGDDAGEEEDVFHDAGGDAVLGDASAFEVGLYAHHCWVLGLDPDATAKLLRGE